MAAVEPAAAVDEPADPQPALGADLGGAANFDGLRGLWNSTRKTHAVLIEGLHPVVVVRENTRTRAAELRLIVGPMPDLEIGRAILRDTDRRQTALPAGVVRGPGAFADCT